jgi:hypothetical protein
MRSHVITPHVCQPVIPTFSLRAFSLFTSSTFKLLHFNRLPTVFHNNRNSTLCKSITSALFSSRRTVVPPRYSECRPFHELSSYPLSLQTLAYSFARFCTFLRSPKTQLFCFRPILHSLPKNARDSPVGSPVSVPLRQSVSRGRLSWRKLNHAVA